MDEEFQGAALGVGGGADGGDLLEVELAREHDLGESHVLQEAGLLRGTDIGLGAAVQLDRRQVELQQAHVLDDQRVDAGVVELMNLPACRFEFVVAQDGVEGDEHARIEAVRVVHQLCDIRNVVGGGCTCAERRPADVYRIGAMVDGFDADAGVARGREQFKLMGSHGMAFRPAKRHFSLFTGSGRGSPPACRRPA